eukprot:SAG11_NODE_329_length_10681_cov_7.861274_11_plen_113_part_00
MRGNAIQDQRLAGAKRGARAHNGAAHSLRHILQDLPLRPWLEIRARATGLGPMAPGSYPLRACADTCVACLLCRPVAVTTWNLQEEAFEASQKYKEGKYIVEKLKMLNDEEP